jgi:hypothetical protein
LPVVFLPGVIHLPTVPAHRKTNRIDLGTADKLCVAALALALQPRPLNTYRACVVELGSAFTACIVLSNGQIVDGLGTAFAADSTNHLRHAALFEKVAAGWSHILGFEIEPRKVPLCMIWMKLVRESNRHGLDNLVDAAGEEGVPPSQVLGGRLRIPDRLSRRYDIPQKWIRLRVDVPRLQLPLPCDPDRWQALAADHKAELLRSIRTAFLDWIASPSGQNDAWRKLHPPSEAFWEPDAWDRFLANARTVAPNTSDLVPNFDAQVLVQPLHDPLQQETFSVRIALENLQENDATKECGLFNVDLIVELPNDALGPMRLERVRRSYHLAEFMTMPAIGVNGGVCDLGTREGVRSLRTTWMPRYVLPRAQATEIPTVPTSYRQLGLDTADVNELAALSRAMRDWIDVVARETELSVPGEEGSLDDETAQQNRFQDDLRAWRSEAARIAAGVDVLAAAQQAWRHDRTVAAGVPYRAWLLLNRTFAAAAPPHDGEPPAGWRLFQLAFVLAHIPTFASRLPEYAGSFDATFDEDSASLLYMATGGGKTEAFFGTLIYALFLDRLRGKHRGITAMMHYPPLRLLTVQQAQRLARLLARAEIVRRTEQVGGSPFEIGFWVGGTNTPNATEKPSGGLVDALRCVPVWNQPRGRSEIIIGTGASEIGRSVRSLSP